MGIRVPVRRLWNSAGREAVGSAAYALGVVMLAAEAAVHLQQYFSIFYGVAWIGPLFLLNAAASGVSIAGVACRRTRPLAALAGVVTSAVAVGSLTVSYGRGLFGWQEVGFRAAIALAVVSEIGAVILLSAALAAKRNPPSGRRQESSAIKQNPHGERDMTRSP